MLELLHMRIISLLLLELLLLLGEIILLLLLMLVWQIRTNEDDIGVLDISALRPSEPMRLLQRTPSQRHSNLNHYEQRRNQPHEHVGVLEVARIVADIPTSKRRPVIVP